MYEPADAGWVPGLSQAGDALAGARSYGVADRHHEMAIGAAEGRGLTLSAE